MKTSTVCALLAIIVTLVAAWTGLAMAENNLGDCLQSNNEGGYNCDNQQDCGFEHGSQGENDCFDEEVSDPACNPNPCQALLLKEIRRKGTCEVMLGINCFFCAQYFCAKADIYQSQDENGQCQTFRESGVWSCLNCCIPL